MLIGAQVRQVGGFVAALRRAEEMGAEVVQLFPQNNRQWRFPPPPGDPAYAAYRAASTASPVVRRTVCHAPYLVNLISPDGPTADRSFSSLVANLQSAAALGAAGLVLHPGSHRGVDPQTAAARIARRCVEALDRAVDGGAPPCDLLLENTAGAGGTVGRSLEELGEIVRAAGRDRRIGICLDTQHLFASGISFATTAEADALLARLEREVGGGRLRCLHLNDSKVPFGTNRDRHETLGRGLIGERALQALLGHPDLQGLPAVLEVPGADGKGPGTADLAAARALLTAGLARRRRHRRAPAAPPGGQPG